MFLLSEVVFFGFKAGPSTKQGLTTIKSHCDCASAISHAFFSAKVLTMQISSVGGQVGGFICVNVGK